MKNLMLLVCLLTGSAAFAGAMPYTPIQLFQLDNEGRETFLENALRTTGLTIDHGVAYENLTSNVIGGDERGADFKGALFGYTVILRTNDRQRFSCFQSLSVGNFDQKYTTEISCEKK